MQQASQSSSCPEQPRSIGGHLAGATVNRWSPSTGFYPRVIVTTKPHPDRLRDPGSASVWWKRRAASHVSQALAPGRVPGRHRRGRDLARPKALYGSGPTGRGGGGLLTPRGRPARKASGALAPGPGPDRGGPRARALGASQRRTGTRRGRARPAARPAARRPRGLGPGAEGRASRRPQRRPPARPRGAPRAPHLPPAPAARPQRRAPRPGRRRHRRPPEGPRGRSSLGGTRLPRAASGGRALARAANPARGLPALGEPPGGLRRPPIGGARRSRPRSAAQ